jgi:hypothetical protein
VNRHRRRTSLVLPLTITIALGVASLYALDAVAGWIMPRATASAQERATAQPQPGFGGSVQMLWFFGGAALEARDAADADTVPALTCAELARRYVSLTWRCRSFGRTGDDSLAALQRMVSLLGDPNIVQPDNVILVGGDEDKLAGQDKWTRPNMRQLAFRQIPHLLQWAGVAVPERGGAAAANLPRAGALHAATLRTFSHWAAGAETPVIALRLRDEAEAAEAAFQAAVAAAAPQAQPFFQMVDLPGATARRETANRIADLISPVERF